MRLGTLYWRQNFQAKVRQRPGTFMLSTRFLRCELGTLRRNWKAINEIRSFCSQSDNLPDGKKSLFGLDSNIADASFTVKRRYLFIIPAFSLHMCIGSPYGWSLVADMLTREVGLDTSPLRVLTAFCRHFSIPSS